MSKKPITFFLVDAFTESAFKGNAAAVCLLEEERDDEWLQPMASEFNSPVTCYLTRITTASETRDSFDGDSLSLRFRIRLFTPVLEVILCGHATLASAHILFSRGLVDSDTIEFVSHSGILTAKKIQDTSELQNGIDTTKGSFSIELSLPMIPVAKISESSDIVSMVSKALGGASLIDIKSTTPTGDFLVVLPSWESVLKLKPNFDEIVKCPVRGLIVTAKAPPTSEFDFVSRFLYPKIGLNEDQVCGSAHCALAPYWSQKLNKFDFMAYVASRRSGIVKIHFEWENQRVLLRGKAVTVMEGDVLV